MTAELLFQSTVLGLSMGAIYILMALGLTLMFGMMHIINFAHGAIYMLGAFAIYYLFAQAGIPYLLAFVLTLLLLGMFGLGIERVIYRTLGGETEPTLVALLALTTLLESSGYLVFGVLDKDVPTVFPGVLRLSGMTLSVERLVIIPIVAVMVMSLHVFMQRTKTGQAMRAIEQDKEAAALQGVNVNRINALAFGIGFALAAAAGALIAPVFAVTPSMGELPLLKAFIIIILGGLGSVPGAILGGVILGLIDGVLATAFGFELAFLLSFVLIIVILLVKPQGLLGHA
ncbi:MAG TPA: branched-chain amino acid ABC transporter permease [Alphaproteobacteria bacterium]|nr:branched-chain amino acid ABC transporter permease [Alphaproteobacteria bacterium]